MEKRLPNLYTLYLWKFLKQPKLEYVLIETPNMHTYLKIFNTQHGTIIIFIKLKQNKT